MICMLADIERAEHRFKAEQCDWFTPSFCNFCEMCLETWDPMKGAIGGKHQHCRSYTSFHCSWHRYPCGQTITGFPVTTSWPWNPAVKQCLLRSSGFNRHTPTPQNLPPTVSCHFPILLPFLCHITFSQSCPCQGQTAMEGARVWGQRRACATTEAKGQSLYKKNL